MVEGKCARRAVVAALVLAAGAAQALDLQAHRGGRGLRPENTLPAFAHALALGVTTLELDIGITRDGVAVVAHDPLLNPLFTRGPDGAWLAAPGPPITTLTAGELARYDVGRLQPGTAYARTFAAQQPVDGTRMPRLAQVFALAAQAGNRTVRFDIETKLHPLKPQETADPATFVRVLLEEVRAAGVQERVTIQSFDWRTLRLVQQQAPAIPTACLTAQRPGGFDTVQAANPAGSPWTAGLRLADHGSVPQLVKAAGCRAWSSHWQDLDAAAVREAQALGLQVLAWTVNEPADMERLLDLGVDGLITDRPDLLREVMARRGLPLPAPTPVP